MPSPLKNASNGPEAAKADKQRKAATKPSRGTKQPKGGINTQHSKSTKMSKKESNLVNGNTSF